MGSTSLTAANVMDKAASLMNDTAKTVYTYAAQMPYLNMALNELEEHFQLNNIPVTNQTSVPITVLAGITTIPPFDGVGVEGEPPLGGTVPPIVTYPQDLVEIQGIYERLAGTTNPFIPLVKREFLPHPIDDLPTESLQYWIWENQVIKFIGATTDREVKLDYIRTIFPEVTNQAAVIGVINAKTFLFYRTAALCTQFIGENQSRATELNNFAVLALDRVTGIGTKAKQSITTRRKPFMAAYKRRSFT
jgi:hypothetical protein